MAFATRFPPSAISAGGAVAGQTLLWSGTRWTPSIKSNYSALLAPSVTDDSDSGYSVGSVWINTVTDISYVCVDATPGAAQWKDVSSSTNPAGTGTELQYRFSSTSFGAVTGSSVASGGISLVSQAIGAVPLTLTGANGQTADLFQTNPYGVTAGTRARVDASGYFAGTMLHGNNASGTNAVADTLYIAPGQSTGSGTPASVVIQGTTAGASGSVAQTLVDIVKVDSKVTVTTASGTVCRLANNSGGGSTILEYGDSLNIWIMGQERVVYDGLGGWGGYYSLWLNTGSNSQDIREVARVTSSGKFGVNTTAPDKQVEINSATGDCLRLTYNDSNGSATNYADFAVSSGGNLTITPSGGTVTIPWYPDAVSPVPGLLIQGTSGGNYNNPLKVKDGSYTLYEIATYGHYFNNSLGQVVLNVGRGANASTVTLGDGTWNLGPSQLSYHGGYSRHGHFSAGACAWELQTLGQDIKFAPNAMGSSGGLVKIVNGSGYASFDVSSGGNLTITPSGGTIKIGAWWQSPSGYNGFYINDSSTFIRPPANGSLKVGNAAGTADYLTIYETGADTIVFNESGIDWDTRIEGVGDQYLTVWDAGTASVLIGTATTSTGMKLRVAGSVQFDNKVVTPNSGALAIATGAITVTGAQHTIDTESAAAADDLDTINGGKAGEKIILRLVNAARIVTIKHATGNIRRKGGTDYVFAGTDEYVELFCTDGSNWLIN